MKTNISLLLGFLLVYLMPACSPKPMISNLHKGPYQYADAPPNILKVTVGILPIPKTEPEKEKPRMPWDLRDSLPHTLIKTFGAKDNADALMKLMAAQIPALEKKEPAPLPTDYTQYKVLITFSNIKRYFIDHRFMHPNTRLEFLNISLKTANNSNFSFYNIDKLVNEFEEIDLGALERNESITFNAKLAGQGELGSSFENSTSNAYQNSQITKDGLDAPVYDGKGNVVGTIKTSGEFTSGSNRTSASKATGGAKAAAQAEASYLNTESIKESINVKLKRMKTGFSFSSNQIVISQRGRVGGDISDNVYVTATMRLTSTIGGDSKDVFKFTNLFDDNRQQTPADKLNFSMRNVNYIPCKPANAVSLTTKYEGAIRAVGNNWKKTGENSMEYDDDVTYYKIAEANGESLKIDENVFCKKVYKITANDGNGELTLRISSPTDKELNLFSDDSPELMLQWVIDAVKNPTTALLNTGKFNLYFERTGPAAKRIFLTKSSLTATNIAEIKTLVDIKAAIR